MPVATDSRTSSAVKHNASVIKARSKGQLHASKQAAQWHLHEVLQVQDYQRVLLIMPTVCVCSADHSTSPTSTSPTFVGA